MNDPSKPAPKPPVPSVRSVGVAEIELPEPNAIVAPLGGLISVQVHVISGAQFAVKVELANAQIDTPPNNPQIVLAANGSHPTTMVAVPAGASPLACQVRVWGWDGTNWLPPSTVDITI